MACGDYFTGGHMDNIDQGVYVICPFCKGKGYCEESELSRDVTNESLHQSDNFSLPVIGSPKSGIPTPVKKQPLKEKFGYRLPSILPEVMNSKDNEQPQNNMLKPPASRGKDSNCSEIMVDLIGQQDIENPTEFLRVVKAQLSSSNWSDRVLGIQGAVHLCRVEPELVVHQGRTISRTILGELGSLRSRCVRIACQASKELFKLNRFVFRPEFDEIVYSLLCRAADNKRTIREEADEALAIIAGYTPVQHVARSITKGPRHKHQMVRKSALRVYKILVNRIGIPPLMKNPNYHDIRNKIIEAGCIFLNDPIVDIRQHQMVRKSALRVYKILVNRIGIPPLMKNPNYHDIRNKIIEAGCIFLNDPIVDIRNFAKDLMKPIVKMREFEDIVAQEIANTQFYQRVENSLFAMKFELDNS